MNTIQTVQDNFAGAAEALPITEHHAQVTSSQPRRQARILLVDDDPAVRDALTEVLHSEHYEVVPAGDGREALTQFTATQPDLVLLDLSLPRMEGWAAFAAMEKRRPFTPVVVITARPHQYERAVGAGIDAIMEKPLDLPRLLAAIAQLLNETRTERLVRLTRHDFKTLDLSERPSQTPPPSDPLGS